MMWPLRTEARNRCIGFVTSRRPVGSTDRGTSTIRPGGTVTGGRVTVGGVEAGGLLVDVVVDVEEDFPSDPPLQAPPTATMAATHAQKGLHARVGRAHSRVAPRRPLAAGCEATRKERRNNPGAVRSLRPVHFALSSPSTQNPTATLLPAVTAWHYRRAGPRSSGDRASASGAVCAG